MVKSQRQAEFDPIEERLRLFDVRDAAALDPKALVNEIRYFDPVTQEWVEFRMFPPKGWVSPLTQLPNGDLEFTQGGANDWFWQAVLIDWLHDPSMHAYLIYKARQLGITLLACAYALWLMLYRPGVSCVAYSYEEGEAQKLVKAVWSMFDGLPKTLTAHVRVLTPSRGELPSEWIRLKHRDGRISDFQALPATERHGHGSRVYFGIMDEVAKQQYARRVFEAIVPATLSRGGKIALISTADGVSNLETGEGNFFHHLFGTKEEKGLRYVFLPWNAEPTRDEEWYDEVARKLPDVERNRQYPLNENDGFILSGAAYFDNEALAFYRNETIHPKFSGQFTVVGSRRANFVKLPDGIIDLYDLPRPGAKYGIAVDTSTGRAGDYTSGDVIDFSSGQIVAHLHAKIEAPRSATQLHFLGKWFNTAVIMVERGGGYGEALIIALRDGNKQLPPYPRIYRHRTETKRTRPMSMDYGFPMTLRSRPVVLERLASWIRQRQFPWLPSGHVFELQSFVHKEDGVSPRAQDGCNDDRVMSLGMAVQLYERYGEAPSEEVARRKKRRTQNKYRPGPVKAGRGG